MARSLVAMTLLLASGCYLSHGGEAPQDAAPARRDAFVPPPPRADSGAPGRFDAGSPPWAVDAGPPLPPEEEPPAAPGERPSDRRSDDWHDAEPTPGVDPCCDLDPVLEVTPPGTHGGRVAVDWQGSGWGVVFHGGPTHFRALQYASLDPEVTRVEVYRSIMSPSGWVADVQWAAGRLGVVTGGSGALGASIALLDRNGVVAAGWSAFPSENATSVTRQALGGFWTVASVEPIASADERGEIMVRGFDDAAREVVAHSLGDELPRSFGALRVEGLVSRVVVAWVGDGRLRAQSVVIGEGLTGATVDLGPAGVHSDSALGSASFRDSAAITHMDGSSVWLTLFNPFDGTSRRTEVGRSGIRDRHAGVVGVDKHGFLGVCIPTGPGPAGGSRTEEDGVDFRLVGLDGEPWGDQVEVVGGLRNIGGCAVAYHLDSFIVVWWRASGDADYNSIWARRVRPRVAL